MSGSPRVPSGPAGGALVGLAGSVMVGVGACSAGFSHQPDGWGTGPVRVLSQLISRPLGNSLIAVGIMVLTLGWWWLRPGHGVRHVEPLPVLALWSLPLLAVPPVQSADPFLYADLGWIRHQGASPYTVPLAGLGGPYAPWVDDFWAGHGVAYPPLSLEINRLMVELAGFDPYAGMLAQRLPALAGVILLAVFLPRLAADLGRSRRWASWLGVLNPFLVVHFVGGAHNDALMTGLVVLALWVSVRPVRWVSAGLILAPVLIGVAMGLKQQAGLAVIAAAGLPIAERLRSLPLVSRLTALGWRAAVAALVALLTFVGTSLATGLGFGWTRWLPEMGRARTITPAGLVSDLAGVLGLDAGDLPYQVFAVAGLAGLAWLVVAQAHRPLLILAWGSLLVLLAGQALHPWYFVLPIALISFGRVAERTARWLLFGGFGYLMAYSLNFLFEMPPWPAAALGAVLGLLARWLHRVGSGDAAITLG